MVSRSLRQARLLEVSLTKIPGGHDFFLIFFQHDIFQDGQTPPSNALKLIEFETFYIEPNPPFFFLPTKHAMVLQHGPFSLHTMLEGA